MSLVLTAYHNNGLLRPPKEGAEAPLARRGRPRQQIPFARNVIIDSSPGFWKRLAVTFLPILKRR